MDSAHGFRGIDDRCERLYLCRCLDAFLKGSHFTIYLNIFGTNLEIAVCFLEVASNSFGQCFNV